MAHLGMSDDKIMDMIKGIRSNLEKYKKEAEASDYKRALSLCNDLEDELKISDPMYEAFDSKVDRHLQMFLESDSLKDDLADEAKQTKDAGDAASAAAFGLLAKSLRNSSLDFMWWDSIFKPTIEWQPFSFGWAQQEYENISAWVTGDASFFKTVGKSFGAARNIKPIFTYLDQQTQ